MIYVGDQERPKWDILGWPMAQIFLQCSWPFTKPVPRNWPDEMTRAGWGRDLSEGTNQTKDFGKMCASWPLPCWLWPCVTTSFRSSVLHSIVQSAHIRLFPTGGTTPNRRFTAVQYREAGTCNVTATRSLAQPETFYTKHLFQLKCFTPEALYTASLLHQKPFEPEAFYTSQKGLTVLHHHYSYTRNLSVF